MNLGGIILFALTNAAFTAAALVALGFLARSIIERWISRNMEKYKAELQAANARELENLRADLRLTVIEHEIRFTKLHEKRAEVIAEFYELLVESDERIRWMGSVLVSDEESSLSFEQIVQKRVEEAQEEFNALVKYYKRHRLYFRGQTCAKIDGLLYALQDTLMQFKVAAPEPKAQEEHWREAHLSISEKIPAIIEVVETAFRDMLGDEVDEMRRT